MNKLLLIRTQLLTRLENLVSDVCSRVLPISRQSNILINGKRVSRLHANNTLATKYETTGDGFFPKLEECKYITNNRDGEIFIKHVKVVDGELHTKENKTKIKIGKLLRAMTGTFLNDVEIELITTEWKKLHTVDLDKVQITDDIGSVYNTTHQDSGDLGGSCMRHQGEKMRIYEDLDCRVAFIMEGEFLVARALIWKNVIDRDSGVELTLHDRIFSSAEIYKITLKSYFDKNNIEFVNEYDVHTKGNVKGNFYDDYLPYIDNMYSLDDDYRLNNYGDDSYGILQQTDGTYSFHGGREIADISGTACECCGDSHHEDDMYYVEDYGYVCESCVDDFPWCEDVGNRVHVDDVWYCEDRQEYYYYEEYKMYLYDCDYSVHVNSYSGQCAIFCEDIGEYVSESADVYYCVDIDQYYYDRDNVYYAIDTDSYYYYNDDLHYLEQTDDYYYDEDAYLEALEELKD